MRRVHIEYALHGAHVAVRIAVGLSGDVDPEKRIDASAELKSVGELRCSPEEAEAISSLFFVGEKDSSKALLSEAGYECVDDVIRMRELAKRGGREHAVELFLNQLMGQLGEAQVTDVARRTTAAAQFLGIDSRQLEIF